MQAFGRNECILLGTGVGGTAVPTTTVLDVSSKTTELTELRYQQKIHTLALSKFNALISPVLLKNAEVV